jgi:hypothetical protein
MTAILASCDVLIYKLHTEITYQKITYQNSVDNSICALHDE